MKTCYRYRLILIMTIFSYGFALQDRTEPAVILTMAGCFWSFLLRRRAAARRGWAIASAVLIHELILFCFGYAYVSLLSCAACGTATAILWAGQRYEGMKTDIAILAVSIAAAACLSLILPDLEGYGFLASLFIPLAARYGIPDLYRKLSGISGRQAVQ